jgi:hypothetical protein
MLPRFYAAGIFSLNVIFTKPCPIDLVCDTGLSRLVMKAVILSRRNSRNLTGFDQGYINEIICTLPNFNMKFATFNPKGIPLMFMEVLGTGSAWHDLNPMN